MTLRFDEIAIDKRNVEALSEPASDAHQRVDTGHMITAL
jgi:hypothetical protein